MGDGAEGCFRGREWLGYALIPGRRGRGGFASSLLHRRAPAPWLRASLGPCAKQASRSECGRGWRWRSTTPGSFLAVAWRWYMSRLACSRALLCPSPAALGLKCLSPECGRLPFSLPMFASVVRRGSAASVRRAPVCIVVQGWPSIRGRRVGIGPWGGGRSRGVPWRAQVNVSCLFFCSSRLRG